MSLQGPRLPQGRRSLPGITVTMANSMQMQVVVATVSGEGVDYVPTTLFMLPAAPFRIFKVT